MKKKPVQVPKHVINVGVAALARETGLAEATVSKKMKNGQTPDQIRAAAAHRQATLASGGKVRGPVGKKMENSQGKPTKSATPTKTYTPGRGRPPLPSEYDMVVASRSRYEALEDAKLRRAKALAERQEIENMLRRGELMPVSYARKWGIRFLIDGRDELLKGPSELADGLAAESDPLKVAAILRGWVERAIAKFEQLEMLWKGDLENEQVA
jgi:hypothetical protein